MYGGLFGDLPPAKSGDTKTDAKEPAASSNNEPAVPSASAVPAAVPDNTAKQQQASKQKPSVTMTMRPRLFVPTHAKRPRPATATAATAASMMARPRTAVTNSNNNNKTGNLPAVVGTTTTLSVGSLRSNEAIRSSLPIPQFTDHVIPPDGTSGNHDTEKGRDCDPVTENRLQSDDPVTAAPSSTSTTITTAAAAEAPALRQLHESTANRPREELYDPYFPNDLLAYWKHKSLLQERERLEQVRRDTVERQRQTERVDDDDERRNTTLAQSSGAVVGDSLQRELPARRGRGRGGVSNLPAWLVEKQKKQQTRPL